MKQPYKIRGKAIALRCVKEDKKGYLQVDKIYLGVPFLYFNGIFNIFDKYKQYIIYAPASYFEPVNPLNKYDPRFY